MRITNYSLTKDVLKVLGNLIWIQPRNVKIDVSDHP